MQILFIKFCKVFPPLIENVVGLILQYRRVTVSEACLNSASSPKNVYEALDDDIDQEEVRAILAKDDKGPQQPEFRPSSKGSWTTQC